MLLDDYQKLAQKTSGSRSKWKELNGALGLCGESGEVVDMIKKHWFQGHGLDKDLMAEELGDCLWYIAELCEAFGMSMGDVANKNICKLERRYPEGFSHEGSVNRGDEQ